MARIVALACTFLLLRKVIVGAEGQPGSNVKSGSTGRVGGCDEPEHADHAVWQHHADSAVLPEHPVSAGARSSHRQHEDSDSRRGRLLLKEILRHVDRTSSLQKRVDHDDDPGYLKVRFSPEYKRLVESPDYRRLRNNPDFQRLMNNPDYLRLRHNLGVSRPARQHSWSSSPASWSRHAVNPRAHARLPSIADYFKVAKDQRLYGLVQIFTPDGNDNCEESGLGDHEVVAEGLRLSLVPIGRASHSGPLTLQQLLKNVAAREIQRHRGKQHLNHDNDNDHHDHIVHLVGDGDNDHHNIELEIVHEPEEEEEEEGEEEESETQDGEESEQPTEETTEETEPATTPGPDDETPETTESLLDGVDTADLLRQLALRLSAGGSKAAAVEAVEAAAGSRPGVKSPHSVTSQKRRRGDSKQQASGGNAVSAKPKAGSEDYVGIKGHQPQTRILDPQMPPGVGYRKPGIGDTKFIVGKI